MIRWVQYLAILLTALALLPGGAHALAFPNKIGLGRDAYFTVQQIYNGWQFVGIVQFAAIGVAGWLAWLLRGSRTAFRLSLAGLLCLIASLAVFFAWVFPANQATANWTSIPADWMTQRLHWEYGHLAAASLVFAALCLLIGAASPRR